MMGLFGFGKKKESNCGCCCSGIDANAVEKAKEVKEAGAAIKVLGSGCAKCNLLEEAVKEALVTMGLEPVVDHVTDFNVIASYGVMTTPALVVDGKVLSYGKVLKANEIVELINKARG